MVALRDSIDLILDGAGIGVDVNVQGMNLTARLNALQLESGP